MMDFNIKPADNNQKLTVDRVTTYRRVILSPSFVILSEAKNLGLRVNSAKDLWS